MIMIIIIIILERKAKLGLSARVGRSGVSLSKWRLIWIVLVSLGQSFEDGVNFLCDSGQSELKLVLETRGKTIIHLNGTITAQILSSYFNISYIYIHT